MDEDDIKIEDTENLDQAPAESTENEETYINVNRYRKNLADKVVAAQEAAKREAFDSAPEVKKFEPESQTRTPEEIFNESYTILGEIGSGEGTAYKAMDRRNSRQVVIKRVHSQIQNLFEMQSDIEKLKQLDHPALPKVYDYVMYNGYVYSVMEYIEGRSLFRHISDGTRYSEKQVKSWAIRIADALRALHQASPRVIHGDIKPSNIILASGDKVYLVDFNIGISEEAGTHTIGFSDGYAPPEQYDFVSANQYSATGRYDDRYAKTIVTNPDGIYSVQSGFTYDASSRAYAIIDEKSDIYSFGATFYFILTGKMPGSSAEQVTPISDTGVRISRKFRKIISKCMERSPKKRYQSARALMDALRKNVISMPVTIGAVLAVLLAVAGIVFGPKLFEKKKIKPEMRPPEEVTQLPPEDSSAFVTTVPTETVVPTATPEPTAIPTPTATPMPTATPEPTATPVPTATPEPIATPLPTATPTPSPLPDIAYSQNSLSLVLKDGTMIYGETGGISDVDTEAVEWVYFGGYPSELVEDDAVINALSSEKFGSDSMAELDGVRYNRVNYTNADGSSEVIYYKNNSIRWKVIGLEDGILTLISENILDFEPVKKEASESDWAESKLRSFLKNGFVNVSFSDKEKRMLVGEPFLLKNSELTDEIKKIGTECTDYARMGHNYGTASYRDPADATWWLMPEDDKKYSEFCYMKAVSDDSFEIISSAVSDTERHGMRPVIRISLK